MMAVATYATAQIVYRNSQRSGIIQNVKVQEYLNKNINEEGKAVIQCLDHKTG